MKVQTTRFGSVEIQADDILLFRSGMIGFEDCQHWVVLADSDSPHVAWLQSMRRPELGLPVVSPRRFLPEYQVRVEASQLENLSLEAVDQAQVLCVVGQSDGGLTLNLRAPVIFNLSRKLGCQVVTSDEQPLCFELTQARPMWKRSA